MNFSEKDPYSTSDSVHILKKMSYTVYHMHNVHTLFTARGYLHFKRNEINARKGITIYQATMHLLRLLFARIPAASIQL